MKPKQIQLNGEYIGQVIDDVFHFDQMRMVGYPHHTAIEREAVEMAQWEGASMLCATVIRNPKSKLYCLIGLAFRVNTEDKETNGSMLLIDDDHFYGSPVEANEYAMRLAVEERK